MSTYGQPDVPFVLLDGYSLRNYLTALEDEITDIWERSDTLGDSYEEESHVGVSRGRVAGRGFYDDANDAIDEALVGTTGAAKVACWGFAGNTRGRMFAGMNVRKPSYKRLAGKDELHKVEWECLGDGQYDQGVILLAHSTVTTAANQTSVDGAASSSNGGAAFLQVSALSWSGWTNVVFTVEHSTDNAVWVTKATFTGVAAAPAAERVVVTGTINRYLRAVHAYTGAGSAESVTAMVGFARR